jgi:mannose/cellobiose epimerase-like protein (N-acyl-D-glucosamine 2-epimerase family)
MDPHNDIVALRAAALSLQRELVQWLTDAAYPLWSTNGVDPIRGGFHECLSLEGAPLDLPRRARVQPRQVYAFANAAHFHWRGDAKPLVRDGLCYFLERFRRPDGLIRTLVSVEGAPLDNTPLLYDQTFALLAFANAAEVLAGEWDLEAEAERLRQTIVRHFKREGPGFVSSLPVTLPLESNPHMHLLEASLAWCERSEGPQWRGLTDELGELALACLIEPSTGLLRENFGEGWTLEPGLTGRRVEPGHQYEWAWLLLRWAGSEQRTEQAARRLIDSGERFGLDNGYAVNALLDDFSVHDRSARLWPQAERLKAGALAARLFGETHYWQVAVDAATTLATYLRTPVTGLWYDTRLPSGQFAVGPVQASTFYHIVCAVLELSELVASANVTPQRSSSAPHGSAAVDG